MNLFLPIAKKFRDYVAIYNRPTVWDVWCSFKKTCLESEINTHPNVINYEIYGEHYFIGEGKGALRLVFQYYLRYDIDSEEYAHYEAIDCVFDVVAGMPELAPALIADCSTQSMKDMFFVIENWSLFKQLKEQRFNFEIVGEEH